PTPLTSPCSVVYLLILLNYTTGGTFIKFLCLEHSERNGTLYESQLSELEIIGLEKADKIYQNVER
ncbi:hypothetical protein, partial [Dehalobacter sp.]|uniref:hypothetical protein n=1 Tax=Dehalobacter sp. TaxID=1962289 RepID=UPI002589919C